MLKRTFKTEFGEDFSLGFDLDAFPFLVDKSWHNDICPSFYYTADDNYYVLWVSPKIRRKREDNSARYVIVTAENLGSKDDCEIDCGGNSETIFSSESVEDLKAFLTFHVTEVSGKTI